MTGGNTDRVSIPAYQTVTAILLRLSSPLFLKATAQEEAPATGPFFDHWYSLRRAANWITIHHSVELPETERANMAKALIAAHKLSHDCDMTPAPDVEHCGCSVASDLIDLAVCMALAEAETAAAHAA
jgi:hypothetical protein